MPQNNNTPNIALKNLGIGHCNIEGGLSTNLAKTTEIKDVIEREKLDIFGLNETNLNPMIDTTSLNLPLNYTFERCIHRRDGSSRGGCGVLISKRVKYRIFPINIRYTDTSKIEAVWIELTDLNILLCFFYRSQKFTPLDIFIDYIFGCMASLSGRKVVWIGDINIDQRKINNLDYKKLDITMKLFGMIQVVTDVTRRSYRNGICTESTIDVVMTNCYSNFTNCKVLDDRIGDHEALKFEMDFKVIKADKFKKIVIRDHSRNNIAALTHYLCELSNYDHIMNYDNIDEATEDLNFHISSAYEKFCPTKVIKCHSQYLFNPSRELLNNISQKRKIYRKFKKAKAKNPDSQKCKDLWDKYKAFKNKYVTNISRRDRKENIVKDLKAKSSKNDLKGIWKTIKTASNLPVNSNKNINEDLDAEGVNKYFTSVGTSIHAQIPSKKGDNFLEYMPDNANYKGMDRFKSVTEGDILEYVDGLANDKSIYDNIPLKVYKSILPSIIEPITYIVNESLSSGVMPTLCKKARVTPVYKGEGDKLDPSNYRPISILPLLGKCIEYFVNQNLAEYVEINNILNDRQFGFRKEISTTYLMLELFDKIYSSKEKGQRPSVVFLDIKKAFDTVDHNLLMKKLKHYGIKGIAYKWFKSYLCNRFQCTKIGKQISIELLILLGVPQGSILGPILFSIFINDIISVCKKSAPFLFADDGALYFEHVDRKVYSNIISELRLVMNWLRINKLCLNPDKTKFMVFDNETNLDIINITDDNANNAIQIKEEKVRIKKYLGLILDHKLSFADHIDCIKKKIVKRVGAMYKSKSLLPLKYRKMFANSLVLPHFDYLDIIWNKSTKTKLNELDVLYKKVAKIALDYDILESSKKVYQDMNWLPLHLRRQLHMSTYMYKIINGKTPPQLGSKFVYISGGSRDAENCNLYTNKSRSHKQFLYLGAKCWNLLPQPLRQAKSAKEFSNAFKVKLLNSIKSDEQYVVNNQFDILYKLSEGN